MILKIKHAPVIEKQKPTRAPISFTSRESTASIGPIKDISWNDETLKVRRKGQPTCSRRQAEQYTERYKSGGVFDCKHAEDKYTRCRQTADNQIEYTKESGEVTRT